MRAAERGALLTKQLLAFSRQEMLAPEVIEPSRRLPEIALLLGGSLRGDIRIDAAIPAELWPIKVDAAALELALLNLGLNARDAMPNGGTLRIAAANRRIEDEGVAFPGDYVLIEVRDTGAGIPADILPRVFEPFFTTKEVGAGTGLGLSQVHGFAHQSGGAVDIESSPGHGTSVRIFLPAVPAPAKIADTPVPNHVHRATGTVLVVEDDIDVADLAAGLLQRCGFTVKLAYRALAALDLLRRGEKVDLIFSDVLMPDGISGIELAEEVRSRFPTVPVLLATGYSDVATDAIAKGLPIITKPYRTRDLCNCVAGILGAQQR
jgi:two-component system, NtrC family, sensor kinase